MYAGKAYSKIFLGVVLNTITYGNIFHAVLIADKNFISHQNKVQDILNDIFKYVDQLYEEVITSHENS